jgi:ferredoxin-NADP reductase
LIELRDETPTVRTFFFEPPRAGFSFRAGQYVVVRISGLTDPRGDSRTFSIASAPSDRGVVAVTTRRGPSPFKRRLFESGPGTPFELWGPFGDFVPARDRPAVLLGGGIGITPFRSMLRQAAFERSAVPIRLLYSSHTPEELIYRGEFEELARRWAGFRPTLLVSGAAPGATGWRGETGRIDAPLVHRESRGIDHPLYYICGPPTMVKELRGILVRDADVPAGEVRTEAFQGY